MLNPVALVSLVAAFVSPNHKNLRAVDRQAPIALFAKEESHNQEEAGEEQEEEEPFSFFQIEDADWFEIWGEELDREERKKLEEDLEELRNLEKDPEEEIKPFFVADERLPKLDSENNELFDALDDPTLEALLNELSQLYRATSPDQFAHDVAVMESIQAKVGSFFKTLEDQKLLRLFHLFFSYQILLPPDDPITKVDHEAFQSFATYWNENLGLHSWIRSVVMQAFKSRELMVKRIAPLHPQVLQTLFNNADALHERKGLILSNPLILSELKQLATKRVALEAHWKAPKNDHFYDLNDPDKSFQ